jgi:hypothetical protein
MKKSISVDQKKRGRGRPSTGGRDPEVSARMPVEVRDKIDNWAQANSCTRSEAVRRLIELGLACGTVTQVEANRAAAPKRAKGGRAGEGV